MFGINIYNFKRNLINKISTFAISYNNLRHEPSYNNPRAKQFQVMDLIEIVSVQTGLQESMKWEWDIWVGSTLIIQIPNPLLKCCYDFNVCSN